MPRGHQHGETSRMLGVLLLGSLLGWSFATWAGSPKPAEADEQAVASAEARLKARQIELPPVSEPKNTYAPTVRVGNLLFVAGHGSSRADGVAVVGKLGRDFDVPQGQAAARLSGLRVLAAVRKELGSLDRVVRLVKTLGMVNASPDFKDHPKVVNGFSDLMVEVFGRQRGVGARSAVGMVSLPGGVAVEVEAVFEVR